MPNQINLAPEFTPNEPEEVKQEEGKLPEEQLPPQEQPAEETEPAGEQEAVKPEGETISEDTEEEAKKQILGLESERQKLLDEIKTLRGERRELKQEQIDKVDDQLIQAKDEISDLYPEDVKTFERIAKAKGLISEDRVKKMVYDTAKQQTLDSFLEKYPEFKPENDSEDKNWNALQRELSLYKMPENPKMLATLLERARKQIMPFSSGEQNTASQRRIKTASSGAGGIQRSSSQKSLTSEQKEVFRRGGWTEEEIKNIENNL